jgi:hypothetical protein
MWSLAEGVGNQTMNGGQSKRVVPRSGNNAKRHNRATPDQHHAEPRNTSPVSDVMESENFSRLVKNCRHCF